MRELIGRLLGLVPEEKEISSWQRAEKMNRALEQRDTQIEELKKQIALLKSELGGLRKKNTNLSDTLERYRAVNILMKDYASPKPEGETARREYVARVAGYFEGSMREQLLHMSTQFKNQLSMFPLTERETDFFRSGVNVIGLLLDWGEECVVEHRSNILTDKNRDTVDVFEVESDESVENIRRAING